ncbi:MAG: hypothetical protein J5877_05150 [Clostridia bacterium]|nr:hypothetical protein [Clostridia bacterium]
MKASESLPNYDSKVRESTNFIIKSIKQTCKVFPSRPAGSEDEQKAQQYVKDTMASFADEIKTQNSVVKYPKTSTPVPSGLFLIISIIFACVAGFIPAITVYLMLSAVFCLSVALFLVSAKTKTPVQNIVCIKNPSGEIKRRIVFIGNINSPVERRLLRISGTKLESIAVTGFLCAIFLCAVYDIFYCFFGEVPYANFVELIFIPVAVLTMLLYNSKQVVNGANGNLTGTFDSLAVMQYLSYNNLKLENTQLVSVSVSAGAWGAAEFLNEYGNSFGDAETVFVSVDCLQSDKWFNYTTFNMSDGLIKSAAANSGVEIKKGKDTLSSSLIAKPGKYKAIRISAADEKENFVYSTREDVVTSLSPMAIEAGLKLSLETAYIFDEKGI